MRVTPLGFPWETRDPFLFCVYHADAYPNGNDDLGPAVSLEGRTIGNDFRIKDGWRMYHGTIVPGFPAHPHRGFETVTVVRRGVVDHSDSLGGAGRYGDGDVQWMTAGKGIQHSEMFPLLRTDQPNPLELFQIWLNLPKFSKMVDPHFSMLWSEQIPRVSYRDEESRETRLELIAGPLDNHQPPAPPPDSWAADTENELAIWYFEMDKGATWTIPPANGEVNRNLYFFEGDRTTILQTQIRPGHLAELPPAGPVKVHNGPGKGRYLFLQARPIAEPVANYGPFVMNTRKEIQETYIDYQQTRFGGWPWSRPDPVHGRDEGKFARFDDGTEVRPT